MPSIFNSKARGRIADVVNQVESVPGHTASDRRPAGHISGKAWPGGGVAAPLFMGKVGYGDMTASAEDWSSLGFGQVDLAVPPSSIHAAHKKALAEWEQKGKQGAPPAAVGPVGGVKKPPGVGKAGGAIGSGGVAGSASVIAINPSCKVITQGTPVIMGVESAGNYVVIFEMCPCGDYDGYTGST